MKDNKFSEDNSALERYIRLCCRMYERMEREGFPWESKEEVELRMKNDCHLVCCFFPHKISCLFARLLLTVSFFFVQGRW